MYLSNYHSHCTFCDGRSYPEDFIIHAISKGIKSYGFSSHAPLPFETYWTMKRDDMPEYIQEINRLKEKYRDKIEIYLGLETDYIDHLHHAKIEYFASLPTDYLISSIHYIVNQQNGKLLCVDGDYQEFENDIKLHFNNSIELVIQTYFDQCEKMVETGGFDIIGHIDKISLNGAQFPGYSVYENLIDNRMSELLKLVATKSQILEINTKSLDTKGYTYPNEKYFELIRKLSIPITINCDTHHPDQVLQGKEQAISILKRYGFKYSMELIKGKWTEYPL